MLYKKQKDLIFRKKFLKSEKFKVILSFLQKKFLSSKTSQKLKFLIAYKFHLKLKRVKTKIVRRCILTNRGRGIIRPFNVSRVILRDMLQCALIPGFSKAVW